MNYWGSFDVQNCGFQAEPNAQSYAEYDVTVAEGGVDAVEGGEGLDLQGAAYTGDQACPDCVDMSTFIDCRNNCSTDRAYAERLAGLARSFDGDLFVTEGYPPSRNHQAACHSNGTCVDIVFSDRNWNQQRIQQFQAQANALGFRAVYEPGPNGSCGSITSCQPHSVTRSTGDHFSLYLQ